MTGEEQRYIQEAFDTNWVAPIGPNVDAFETEFCEVVSTPNALALSSGTAALHLALSEAGVGAGDEVLVSTLTFIASVNPIVYLGAVPTFIDSERTSWNMDSCLLEETLAQRAREDQLPRAVVLVHLYGQSADVDPILAACNKYGVALIEDAAEALGTTYKGKAPGTFGLAGTYSFNGNKIITTSGGGMLVSPSRELVGHARKLATQARDQAPHYQHSEIGFNYRLSNISAGIGRAQLTALQDRVERRRWVYQYYQAALADLPGLLFQPEAPWGRHARWLTCVTIDPKDAGTDREQVRQALEAANVESRPVWKPMHLQPVFTGLECFGGRVAEDLFTHGLCLPSGSNLTQEELERVIDCVRACFHGSRH